MIGVDPGEEVVELRIRHTNASLLEGIFKIGFGKLIIVVPIHTLEKRPERFFGMSNKCGEICNSHWLASRPSGGI